MVAIDTGIPLPTSSASTNPLELPGARIKLADDIKRDIDAYCVEKYSDGHRSHLGASIIGHECSFFIWSTFRWLVTPRFDGRMLRLFQRGHNEEARFMEYLEGIGAQVVEFQENADDNADKGAQQYRIKGVFGHLGGSLDGQLMLPEKYGVSFGLITEYKTKGTGAGFSKLCERGVILEAPQHFAQMSMYGRAYGYEYALYMCVNKNDDSLHVEVVKLDWRLGEELERKATDIIFAQYPPEKIAKSAAFKTCKFCAMQAHCFSSAPVEKNCRSCANARPVDKGEWWCDIYSPEANAPIPKDYITQGCDNHKPIS